ncbi:MAG TPA: hypothetical protein VI756_24050, partial [Blastocatellia bacterium]
NNSHSATQAPEGLEIILADLGETKWTAYLATGETRIERSRFADLLTGTQAISLADLPGHDFKFRILSVPTDWLEKPPPVTIERLRAELPADVRVICFQLGNVAVPDRKMKPKCGPYSALIIYSEDFPSLAGAILMPRLITSLNLDGSIKFNCSLVNGGVADISAMAAA